MRLALRVLYAHAKLLQAILSNWGVLINQIPQTKMPHSYERGISCLAHPERFELPTKWFEATYSIQLSYGCINCLVICLMALFTFGACPRPGAEYCGGLLLWHCHLQCVGRRYGCLAHRDVLAGPLVYPYCRPESRARLYSSLGTRDKTLFFASKSSLLTECTTPGASATMVAPG